MGWADDGSIGSPFPQPLVVLVGESRPFRVKFRVTRLGSDPIPRSCRGSGRCLRGSKIEDREIEDRMSRIVDRIAPQGSHTKLDSKGATFADQDSYRGKTSLAPSGMRSGLGMTPWLAA